MTTDERREFYRLEDTIALEFTLLQSATLQAPSAAEDSSVLFNLLSDLHLLDFESQHMLRHISERDRMLSSYLKVVNKRIDLIGQALAQTLLQRIGTPQQVTLSEGGMSFTHDQPLAANELLNLRMVLLPQALGLQLTARVRHSESNNDGGFTIATEFEALSDAQRQMLARHILQKQAQQRREARDTDEPI